MDRPRRRGRAHPLHAAPLLGRLVDGLLARPRHRRAGRLRAVPQAQARRGHQEPAAARRDGLHPAEQVGHRDPPLLGRQVPLAPVRLRHPARLPRRRPRRTGRDREAAQPADPGHEPGVHRQGRLLHRHQAGPTGRRGRGGGRREARHARRRPRARPLPVRGAGQGLAPTRLRRPPRRDHRLRIGPGVPGPAGRLAGGARPGRRRPGRGAGRAHGADLHRADLHGADLHGADLHGGGGDGRRGDQHAVLRPQ